MLPLHISKLIGHILVDADRRQETPKSHREDGLSLQEKQAEEHFGATVPCGMI